MYKIDRLMAFCDAVMAIAITILVLGLEVPSVHDVPEKQLDKYLLESIRPVLGYVSSFVLIGTYWLQHYVICHFITHANRPFVALNGVFLLIVSFVPFPTGLQATYRHDELAMVIYAGTQAACGLSLLAIWTYATTNHRLVLSSTSPQVIQSLKRRIALTPVISLAAMAISFVNIDLSRGMFLAIPVIWLSHRGCEAPPSEDANAESTKHTPKT